MAVKLIASAESSSPIQHGRILYVRVSSFICVEYIIQDMCLGLLDATTRLGMEVIVDGAYIDDSPSWLLWCSSHHVHVHPSELQTRRKARILSPSYDMDCSRDEWVGTTYECEG